MEQFEPVDWSAVIPAALVLPDDSWCDRCGFFDVSREDVRAMLKAAGKPLHSARCRCPAEPESSQGVLFDRINNG